MNELRGECRVADLRESVRHNLRHKKSASMLQYETSSSIQAAILY